MAWAAAVQSDEGAVAASASSLSLVTPIHHHLGELWLANDDLLVSMTETETGTDYTDPDTSAKAPGTAVRDPGTAGRTAATAPAMTAGLLTGLSRHRASPDTCRGAGCAPSGTAATMSDEGPPSQT